MGLSLGMGGDWIGLVEIFKEDATKERGGHRFLKTVDSTTFWGLGLQMMTDLAYR